VSLALFRTEMFKQWRRPRTYVALGVLVLIPLIFTIALKSNPPSPRTADAEDAYAYLATKTGLYLGVASLFFLSRFLLVVVVAVFAGDAIASEASWGNLRAMLVRPITRSRLLTVKLASAVLLAVVAATLVPLTGLALGGVAFGWHPLEIPGAPSESSAHILASLALATVYVLWSLSPVIAFGFMASTMTDTPAGAIFSAIGIYIVSQVLDGISALGRIRSTFPTHHFDAWTSMFIRGTGPTTDMLHGALLVIPYTVVMLAVAWWWFNRKDILS
jgi:ABC-2 type transport system permease protein